MKPHYFTKPARLRRAFDRAQHLVSTGYRLVRRLALDFCGRSRDRVRGTEFSDESYLEHLRIDRSTLAHQLEHLVDNPSAAWPVGLLESDGLGESITDHKLSIEQLCEEAMRHQFDLLGSGLVHVNYNLDAKGIEGHRFEMKCGRKAADSQRSGMLALLRQALEFVGIESDSDRNLAKALEIRPASRSGDTYDPIDWHLDFKSGYRWNQGTWYRDNPYGRKPGVDIKVPWELSRFQHTAWMGLSATLAGMHDNPVRWKGIGEEWALQVLDWIVSNPVRYGVNWRSAMDVSIRAVNWIWGLAIFRGHPALSPAVRWCMTRSLYRHGLHIENHLDYWPCVPTSNHYLADIVGLLHIAAAFPEFAESNRWVAFCLQELVSEMGRTVYPDGASYEASTCYHRLVTEMFLCGTLLALRLPAQRRMRIKDFDWRKQPVKPRLQPYSQQQYDLDRPEIFPSWYFSRLERMAEFICDLTKPNGRVPIFGDNDNGRLVKLTPVVFWNEEAARYCEEFRDHRHLLATAGMLFDRKNFQELGKPYVLDAKLLVQGIPSSTLSAILCTVRSCSANRPLEPKPLQSGGNAHLPGTAGVRARNREHVFYPDIGIAVYRREELWLAIAAGPNGMLGHGGHGHVDKLSFELCINGRDVIVDPGTYVYTPLPAWRNRLRSANAHNTWFFGGMDELTLGRDLFAVKCGSRARVLRCDAQNWIGEWRFSDLNLTLTRSLRLVTSRESDKAPHDTLALEACEGLSWTIGTGNNVVEFKDTIVGIAPSDCFWQLSLAPGGLWDGEGGGRIRLDTCSVRMDIGMKSCIKKDSGYFSPAYGVRMPIEVLRVQIPHSLQLRQAQ